MATLLIGRPELAQARQDGDDMVLDGVVCGDHANGDVQRLPDKSVRVVGGAAMTLVQLASAFDAALAELTN